MVEHKAELSESKKPQIPVIQIPVKRTRDDDKKNDDDADEPWICRGRD